MLYTRWSDDLNACPRETTKCIQEYHHGTWQDSSPFESFPDRITCKKIETALRKDFVWSSLDILPVPSGTPQDEKKVGTWTPFQKDTSEVRCGKSLIEYLPVISEPPIFSVCKHYLDNLINQIAADLNLNHIFAHADEDILSKLWQIVWKFPGKYNKFTLSLVEWVSPDQGYAKPFVHMLLVPSFLKTGDLEKSYMYSVEFFFLSSSMKILWMMFFHKCLECLLEILNIG